MKITPIGIRIFWPVTGIFPELDVLFGTAEGAGVEVTVGDIEGLGVGLGVGVGVEELLYTPAPYVPDP